MQRASLEPTKGNEVEQALRGELRWEAPREMDPIGSFQRHWRAWQRLPGIPDMVLRWIRDGYYVKPGDGYVQANRNRFEAKEWNGVEEGEQTRWTTDEVARWCSRGICSEVTADKQLGIYHPLKVAPKAGWEKQLTDELRWRKKYRLCVAVCKDFNEALKVPPLKMETLKKVILMIGQQSDDWLASGDLDSGYNHAALDPRCKKFFRFKWKNRCYQMEVLFFGLATAPWVFSTMIAQLVRLWRTRAELKVSTFIDDLLLMMRKQLAEQALQNWIWPVSGVCGLAWGGKCSWKVERTKKHLGLLVDVADSMVCVPQEKAADIRRRARYLLKRRGTSVGLVLTLVGKVRAAGLAIRGSQFLAWALSVEVAEVVRQEIPDPRLLTPKQLKSAWAKLLKCRVEVSTQMSKSAAWLAQNVTAGSGKRWTTTDVEWLLVDGSPWRTGGIWRAKKSTYQMTVQERTRFEGYQSKREVLALRKILETFAPQLRGKRVGVLTDCDGQRAAIVDMRNGALAQDVAEIFWFCLENQMELAEAQWLPGDEMIRRGGDALSRLEDVNDWTLRREEWQRVRDWCVSRGIRCDNMVDRFASVHNAKMRRWNSRYYEPGCEAADCLIQQGTGQWNWVCPPIAMIGRVLQLVIDQKANVLLVVPEWRHMWWWATLPKMTDNWMRLGEGNKVFEAGPSGKGAAWRRTWVFWVVAIQLEE